MAKRNELDEYGGRKDLCDEAVNSKSLYDTDSNLIL